jgi:SAM-dependent methyltransferase
VEPGFFALLRCPVCKQDAMHGRPDGAVCGACHRVYDHNGAFFDLLNVYESGEPVAHTAEQRLMQSELVARVYERFWRPSFVRLVAGRGAGQAVGGFPGEFFIHKNCLAMDDREGPWLDLSCGPGLFTRAMAACAPSSLVLGLDISKAMLDVAAQRAKGYANVAFIRGDAHALPFVDSSLGGINNSNALHAYDDPEQVFCEILRVLRAGGVYVGSTFSRTVSLASRVTARLTGIRRFDPHELHAWLSRLGFSEYEEIHLGGTFIFKVRKP